MKKITALILAGMIGFASLPAQNVGQPADSTTQALTVVTDSAATQLPAVDFAAAELLPEEPEQTPVIGVDDGRWSVNFDGEDYILSKLVKDSEFAEKFEGLETFDSETLLLKDNMGLATVIMLIIFGFPCLTIIVGLIVIMMFALRRNRGRNELINNAIEHNYQLPDAFYLGQKGQNGNGPAMPMRDSRKFYGATSLIAVGLSLVIFAIYADVEFFILAGGIPLLIGVGQLIGYYCVPTTPRHNARPPYGGTPYNRPYPPVQPQPWMNPCQNEPRPMESWQVTPQQPMPQPMPPQQSGPVAPQGGYPETPIATEQDCQQPAAPQSPDMPQTPPPYNSPRQ